MQDIEKIEKRLWASADNLRANSNFASNEYFLPVMGLIFLRHAYSRFLKARAEIEPTLPKRGGQTRSITKEDFSGRGAIYLKPEAQFDHLASLPESADRAKAIIDAMESIEADYESLAGTLPKSEYTELDNDVLGNLLRVFNDPALQKANGDIFGRIYEYFLTQFADLKAHDGGEFFTPIAGLHRQLGADFKNTLTFNICVEIRGNTRESTWARDFCLGRNIFSLEAG